MVKYFCDRCGTELDIDDYTAIHPGITENAQKIDLCLVCARGLDDVINNFVKQSSGCRDCEYDEKEPSGCRDCEYDEKEPDEYPCVVCAKRRIDYFKRKEN